MGKIGRKVQDPIVQGPSHCKQSAVVLNMKRTLHRSGKVDQSDLGAHGTLESQMATLTARRVPSRSAFLRGVFL